MNLYQMMNGVDPATFFILPMLGKHPDSYPRFRDCFTEERHWVKTEEFPAMEVVPNGQSGVICVLCRVGKESWATDEERGIGHQLRAQEGYLREFDDAWDATYRTYVFAVPERWKTDYEKITQGDLLGISSAYKQELYRVYPKLKAHFDALFGAAEALVFRWSD